MQEVKEFTEKVVQIHRVSKKTKGGNRIGFSVVLVVGDRKGKVGVGLGKAPDVKSGIKKAVRYAKKHLISVPLTKEGTIPHDIYLKFGAAKVLLRRAPEGTGVIAGGAVRAVVEAAGVRNIVSKVLGTSNQASNVYATLEALRRLKPVHERAKQVTKEEKFSETVAQKDSLPANASPHLPASANAQALQAGAMQAGETVKEKNIIKEKIEVKEVVKVEKEEKVKPKEKKITTKSTKKVKAEK